MPRKFQKTTSRSKSRRPRRSRVRSRCYFCDKGTDPLETGEDILLRFLTRRGKIRPQTRSGLCSKHQRVLSRAIKRGRNLGTLPYRIIA
ncbi:MAG TPA: 30S ribosomal protein S18 [candidate division WWE3 bacterium]|uniref:30S ribosomal protein S18 n=1 Tax=candidate division WWE3 bacterium TaxID=2053526 RepID=A0A7C1T5X7_UNCKA|nr:30S ribosomal protein S18 [candidate division WWE3 bacterium]